MGFGAKIGIASKYFGVLKSNEKEVKEWEENIKKGRREFDKEAADRIKKIREQLK